MPCSRHVSTNSKCLDCFTADVLALTDTEVDKAFEHQVNALAKRYAGLAPKGDAADSCKSIIFGLNTKLVANKLALFGAGDQAPVAPGAITAAHRLLHRDDLRQMGTWIGITEFELLARMFGVRFHVAFPARPRTLSMIVGDPLDTLIAPLGLLWEDNHYQVATLTPHLAGGFIVSNIVATNPLGDCAFESFLLLLTSAPLLVMNPIMAGYNSARRSVIRLFRLARNAPLVGNVLDATDVNYLDAIGDLRDLLATQMTDAEVDDAIIAEGALPESEDEQVARKKQRSGGKVPVPALALGGAPAELPWGAQFAISAKKLGQAGMQPLAIQRIPGTAVYSVGGNFNPSAALWDGSVAFVGQALAGKLNGGYDADTAFYDEQAARKDLGFVDAEGTAMRPRSTHICSCLAAITTDDGTTRYFLFAAVNMQPGKGASAKPKVSTLKKGESGTHSEKICFGLLAHVLRGFGVVVGNKVLGPVVDCCQVDARGAVGVHSVTRVDVMFMNIAVMCDTCEGYWGQFREALLAAGVGEARCYTWYFAVDIKGWR